MRKTHFFRDWKDEGSQKFWRRAYLKSVYLQSILVIAFPIDAAISLVLYCILAHGLHVYYTASFWALLSFAWSVPPCSFILYLFIQNRKTSKRVKYDLDDEDLREDYERDELVDRTEDWGARGVVRSNSLTFDEGDEAEIDDGAPPNVGKKKVFAFEFIADGYVQHKFRPTIWNGLGISACVFGILASIMGSVCNFLVADIAGGLAALITLLTVCGCMYFIIHRSLDKSGASNELVMSHEDAQHLRRKYLLGIMWRVACAIAGVLAVGITILAALQSFVYAFNVHYYPPPGKLYDIGDSRVMHMNCIGTGGPTVVFLHGWGGQAYDWSWVTPSVSNSAKACALDRTGYGWSDPPNCVLCARTAEMQAKDLNSLFISSGINRETILFVVGSEAVLDVRVFVNTYKDYTVCGIVCVDCLDTAILPRVGAHEKNPAPYFWDVWRNVLPSGIPGVLAAANRLPKFEIINTLPNDIHPIYIQNQLKPKYPQSVVRDHECLPQSAQQAIDAGDFGSLKLSVLVAGKGFNASGVSSLSTYPSVTYVPKAPRDMAYHHNFAQLIIDQVIGMVFSSKCSHF